jgi:uncharacterized membrane protein
LGLFLASFVQCVLTLIAIRERDIVWVPQVTILTTIALVVFSFFALVYLCHRIARAIQIGNVLAYLVGDIRHLIRGLPTAAIVDPVAKRIATDRAPLPQDVIDARSELCERHGAAVHATRSGYLQEVDHVRLFIAAHRADAVIRLQFRVGQFVTKGSILAYVLPAERAADLARAVDQHHMLGRQRTLAQDLEFGIAQLVEIALRALSPAINDSYTGIYCVDWLGEALLELASVRPSDGASTTPSGTIRLLEPPLRYSRFVKAGFNQIRQIAPANPALVIRLFQTFAGMMSQLTNPEHRQAVRFQVEALWEMVSSFPIARTDQRDIEEAYELARGAAVRPIAPPPVFQAAVLPISGGPASR